MSRYCWKNGRVHLKRLSSFVILWLRSHRRRLRLKGCVPINKDVLGLVKMFLASVTEAEEICGGSRMRVLVLGERIVGLHHNAIIEYVCGFWVRSMGYHACVFLRKFHLTPRQGPRTWRSTIILCTNSWPWWVFWILGFGSRIIATCLRLKWDFHSKQNVSFAGLRIVMNWVVIIIFESTNKSKTKTLWMRLVPGSSAWWGDFV